MKHILIVSREPLVREGLSRVLRDYGSVCVAESGDGRLPGGAERSFQLCFLDIAHPGVDGVQIGLRLRRWFPEMRIVVMTAMHLTQGMALAIEQFADRFIPKPLDFEKVRMLAAETLEVPGGTAFLGRTERRRDPRVVLANPARLPVRFTEARGRNRKILDRADVIDMSRTGLCLRMNRSVEPGLAIVVDRKPGVVRWHRNGCKGRGCLVGIEFVPDAMARQLGT